MKNTRYNSCGHSCSPSDMTLLGCKCDDNNGAYAKMFVNLYPYPVSVEHFLTTSNHYGVTETLNILENEI